MILACSEFAVLARQQAGTGFKSAGKMALIREAAFIGDAGQRAVWLANKRQGPVDLHPAHVFAQGAGKVAGKMFGDGNGMNVQRISQLLQGESIVPAGVQSGGQLAHPGRRAAAGGGCQEL
jgi:hypothetical protein